MVEKSVDCPPTVPQYCCWTPFFPPRTIVLEPCFLAMVICATDQVKPKCTKIAVAKHLR